jgi:hypothetical protein
MQKSNVCALLVLYGAWNGIVSYRLFGGSLSVPRRLKMGLVGCPETYVTNYQSTLRKIPDEQRPNLTPRRKPEATHNVRIISVIVIEFCLLGIQLRFEFFSKY